jgi:glyoxylase-like metal-dependent hydrolase (beta-lactamase superfamily II)
MRAVSVHEDAIVVTSLFWQLNAVALRAGDEAMLIDSPYFPEELDLLPAVLAQSGFEPVALLATHVDFDHVLGRMAFPDLSLGVAESSMLRVRAQPGEAQRELRDQDERAYVVRPRPLSLGQTQSLPVPGRLGLGDQELELHATGGHTSDGMAVFAPWMGVLVVGDHLSPVEIPMISPGGSVADYRSTLAALSSVIERADTVVPGHGSVLDRDAALRIAEQDMAYLSALERGDERPALPDGRASGEQRRIHAENLQRI